MQETTRIVPNIQVLRGIAALLVVIAHLAGELDDRGLPGFMPNMTVGVFGVDLFFVISGFVMVYANAAKFGTGAAGEFLLRRVIRIVPLYWLFTTIFAFVQFRQARHTGLPEADLRHIVASYLFIPSAEPETGDIYPTYSLGWTLNYEMFFYLCMALVLMLRRGLAVAMLSALFALFVLVGAIWHPPMPVSWWARSQILEFVFGMLIALAMLGGIRMPRWMGLILAGACALTVPLFVSHIDEWDVVRGLAWGIPAAGIVAGFSLVVPRRSSVAQRAFEYLGDASYSLYLVHYAFFVLVAVVLNGPLQRGAIPASAYASLLFVGSIVSALALYRFVEWPTTRLLLRLAGLRRSSLARQIPGPSFGAVGSSRSS